jgi:hypothetical protein
MMLKDWLNGEIFVLKGNLHFRLSKGRYWLAKYSSWIPTCPNLINPTVMKTWWESIVNTLIAVGMTGYRRNISKDNGH